MFNYNKKIIVNYRKGTSDDPYVNINESHIVNPDGKVILTEIPLEFNRVIATSSDGERYYEIQEGIPKDNEYKVDYINKIVTFSPNNIGKQFNFDYVGIGQHYLPVDMIYTEENNGIVTETLKQLTDSTKQARDTANNAADNVNTKAKYAQQQGDYAKAQGDYAKQVGDENKTRWLTAVNTYANIATTYPNPQLGDTVQTIDDSKIYRWDGTQWVWTQQYNANAITDVQNKIGVLSTADDVLFQNDRSIFLEIDKYKKLRFQQGLATITGVDSNGYFRDNEPFVQVTLTGYAQINAPIYAVVIDVISSNGDYGQLIVYDKTQNGFKVKMTGSASSVTFMWTLLNPLVA